MLADRIGRKPTAVLAYVGLAISFSFTPLMFGVFQDTLRRNPYIIMTGSLWTLLGGGIPVLLNTLYAVAADVSTEQQKYVYSRATRMAHPSRSVATTNTDNPGQGG